MVILFFSLVQLFKSNLLLNTKILKCRMFFLNKKRVRPSWGVTLIILFLIFIYSILKESTGLARATLTV